MTTLNRTVRRATVEDVQPLGALWEAAQLPKRDLAPRFKEFQIVEGDGGSIIAAIGFQILGTEGRLHSEAFADPVQADALRSLLWERAQLQAKNHGLVRIWTQLPTPFWRANGFQYAGDDLLKKLPEAFVGDSRLWLCLPLREDLPPELSIDKEFMLFREQEREQTERILRQARVLKMLAAVISVVVFFLVLIWAVFFLKYRYGAGNL